MLNKRNNRGETMDTLPYLKEISLKRDKVDDFDTFPFTIPAVREI